MIDTKIIKFIQKPGIEQLLSENRFDEIYTILAQTYNPKDNAELTQLLTAAGVDFLSYMSKIPAYCFHNSSIEDINISDSIKEIGKGAFWRSRLTSIKIPRSVRHISDLASADIPLEGGSPLTTGL